MLPKEVEEAGDLEAARSPSPDTDIEMSDLTQMSEGVVGSSHRRYLEFPYTGRLTVNKCGMCSLALRV